MNDVTQREIKFIVYNKKTGLMYHSHMQDGSLNILFNWSVVFEDYANDPDLIKRQYTGKHDKNGTEIYDGHLMRYHDPYDQFAHRIPYLVRWSEDECCFECVNHLNFMLPSVWCEMKIIGNRFEQPELLKDTGLDI